MIEEYPIYIVTRGLALQSKIVHMSHSQYNNHAPTREIDPKNCQNTIFEQKIWVKTIHFVIKGESQILKFAKMDETTVPFS